MVALSDHTFWPLLHLSRWAGGLEEHFRRFMQSHISPATLDLRGGHLQQLVASKGEEFAEEYNRLLLDDAFLQGLLASLPDQCPARELQELSCVVRGLVLHTAAAFNRRLLKEAHKVPIQVAPPHNC